MGLMTDDDLPAEWQRLVDEWDVAAKHHERLVETDAAEEHLTRALEHLNQIKRRMDVVISARMAQRRTRSGDELVQGIYSPKADLVERPVKRSGTDGRPSH